VSPSSIPQNKKRREGRREGRKGEREEGRPREYHLSHSACASHEGPGRMFTTQKPEAHPEGVRALIQRSNEGEKSAPPQRREPKDLLKTYSEQLNK
jgi:hypothetical protein